MENLKVIRKSKQESLTREVELFKDEKQLAQNYINSEGFIFEEADLIPTNLKLDIEEINSNALWVLKFFEIFNSFSLI